MVTGKCHMVSKKGGPLAALLLVLLALGVVAPSSVSASPTAQSQDEMNQMASMTGKDFEIQFMSMMIAHHTGGVEMAQLAFDRSNRQEIKDAAQKIIDAQSSEKQEMTAWLQQWYNTAPLPPSPSMQQMSMDAMAKLQSLKGDAFDQEFLLMFRMHHTNAIDMASLVPSRATHAELKTLAQNIITSQTAERQQFVTWLKAWFNIDIAPNAGSMMPSPVGMPRTGANDNALNMGLAVLGALSLASVMLVLGVRLRKRA